MVGPCKVKLVTRRPHASLEVAKGITPQDSGLLHALAVVLIRDLHQVTFRCALAGRTKLVGLAAILLSRARHAQRRTVRLHRLSLNVLWVNAPAL